MIWAFVFILLWILDQEHYRYCARPLLRAGQACCDQNSRTSVVQAVLDPRVIISWLLPGSLCAGRYCYSRIDTWKPRYHYLSHIGLATAPLLVFTAAVCTYTLPGIFPLLHPGASQGDFRFTSHHSHRTYMTQYPKRASADSNSGGAGQINE